ncbi:hypothetical protein [Pontivivens ytuae]|uniref:Uncharacterized protein n=1 Tax=Pontivivens ytuae TaxID=2789856 RepID=A0A7S9QBQ7_9RHOB|nr:hypothetical protein [Pontivivens ytuae]QPH53418.1 hypothetical protein I0K15_16765 [Pontivivens ytuae]
MEGIRIVLAILAFGFVFLPVSLSLIANLLYPRSAAVARRNWAGLPVASRLFLRVWWLGLHIHGRSGLRERQDAMIEEPGWKVHIVMLWVLGTTLAFRYLLLR